MLLLALGSCSSGERQTDPQDRISFVVPEGWEAKPGSNGTRFAPPGAEGRKVHLQINTLDPTSYAPEKERDVWLSAQESRGETIVLTKQYNQGDLQVLEYAHTATGVHGDVIWHHALMTHDNFRVPAYIMVSPDAHEQYLPVFRNVIKSVKVLEPAG